MRLVAHMLCRNEVDVIEETVREAMRWADALVILDGQSDDGTMDVLTDLVSEFQQDRRQIVLVSLPDPGGKFHDHIRNRLLALTEPFAPHWVMSIDADEIFQPYDHNGIEVNPRTAIEAAELVGANVVRCHVPQFWLTFDDLRNGLLHEDESQSVQQRRRWYTWGHMVTNLWRWHRDHYYPVCVPKRTPELPGYTWRMWQRAGPLSPILKHYCFRSLRQGIKRTDERLARGGRKYFGKYAWDWVIDEKEAGLHYKSRESPDPEGPWIAQNNHEALYAWIRETGEKKR